MPVPGKASLHAERPEAGVIAQAELTDSAHLPGNLERCCIGVTDHIGLVPFADAGDAYATLFPNFQQMLRTSVGLGLRYYTGFGPFRVDVAFPLQRQAGDSIAALYIGIGQSF